MNKVQAGLRLPLTGLAPPRLLMCSASMGAEGSVTLQLREAVQAPVSESGTTINNVTIGYPDPDVLADMLGIFQAGGTDATFDIVENGNRPQSIANAFFKANGLTTTTINKTETVAKVIETVASSSVSHHTQKISPSSSTAASIVVSTQQPLTMTTLATTVTPSTNSNLHHAAVSSTPAKKQRPKTASPTRHGPQVCQVCSKVFGNASALAKHKLTHSDERKYVCGMCSKAFKRQDHLNGHMLTHRNKKPYECKAEGCGKSYCDARSLRRHTENHHSTLVLTTSTASSQNQSNSMSSNNTSSGTSTITNPSLSPATASGDASSPHGATCIQYQINGDGNTITAINSKSPSPSSPTGTNNEGLTRQQLDLISQIMQQTKQANGQKTTVQRPRTWNMQTQLQNVSKTSSSHENVKTTQAASPNSQQNGQKAEQKPVECNLCHRKFKNIPALNGHMRLHGGYFKKDTDTKKSDKKESSGPPLQTASVGVRALIEEKIINKRSKDLKGAFVVPAAPLSATRRLAEAEAFLNAKNVNTLSNTNNNTIKIVASGITSTSLNGLAKQAIVQQVAQQTSPSSLVPKAQISPLSSDKDATLIELLKRGTKVAVKRTCSDPGQQTSAARVIVPTSISSPETSSVDSTTSLVLSNGSSSPLSLTISQAPSTSGSSDIYTLAYSGNNSPSFLSDQDVYNVNDTAMLLQAVDSIQLLQDSSTSDQLDDIGSLSDYTSLSENVSLNQSFTPSRQLQAVLDSPLPDSLVEFGTLNSKDYMLYGSNESPTTSASPLPSPYPTPPASHETIAQASPFLDDSHHFSDGSTFFHEDKKTKNFLLDDNSEFFSKSIKDNSNLTESERILQLKNELFNDSKNVLEETSNFFRTNKSILDEHDLFKGDNSFLNNDSKTFIGDNSAKLQDFNQNLDFLDEAQAFNIDDDRNTSSPLSAAFFSAAMSTAEEVKEALDEILPNEDDGAGPNEISDNSDKNILNVQTQQILTKENIGSVFLSPNSISSSGSSPKLHCALVSKKKMQIDGTTVKKHEQFKSNMKKTSQLHYTPSPMLNPERQGNGLFSRTSVDKLIDVDDEEVNVIDFFEKPRVNIGSDYQVSLSTDIISLQYDENKPYETLLWKPNVLEDNRQLDRFIDLAKSSAVMMGLHSIESALKVLMESQGEVHVAVLKLLQAPDVSLDKRWTQNEMEKFLKGLERYGKDFSSISRDVESKTTADCVQLYYFWKKLCNEYKSTHLPQHNRESYNENNSNNNTTNCENNFFDYSNNHNNSNNLTIHNGNIIGQNNPTTVNQNSELRPHVCEVPDCSASFSSRVALHGHTRIHCIGRSMNQLNNGNLLNNTIQAGTNLKDDFPCKVCGK
ncbi:CLUMA_CG020620, isoform A [Clunio marinus]|uniref:CLUMA_CG020620, isoform A n=1 Tax=Clunio marinus TaxID=568069 RepID=A0A1J1J5H1_9DIPT|nr:CLUMA_CG020620, isoform A [Clunio marinus]